MKRLALAAICCLASAAVVRATETENLGISVLPAPGTVVVDGKFDDWDLSGSIFACGDAENYREKLGVWFAAMYDQDYLYLLARWIDDTPLSNPGSTAGDFGWNGDCLQVRVATHYDATSEQVSVFNCWKGVDGRDVVERDCRGKTKNSPKGDDVKPLGAKQAFRLNADNKGYVQEIAIPWKLTTFNGESLKAGDQLVLTIEPNFTAGPTNGRMSIKDVFRPGMKLDRVFTFQNKRLWGEAPLEPHGRVALRSVRLSDGREFKTHLDRGVPVIDWSGLVKATEMAGFKPITFEMPEDGWEYPNEFAGVHGSHEAPPPVRGMIRGAFGPIGAAKVPTVGHLWAINSNVGEWHVLTQDGYCLG